MEKRFCPNCDKTGPVKVIQQEETYKVREMDIRITSALTLCSNCGKTFATETQEEENIRKAYGLYETKTGRDPRTGSPPAV